MEKPAANSWSSPPPDFDESKLYLASETYKLWRISLWKDNEPHFAPGRGHRFDDNPAFADAKEKRFETSYLGSSIKAGIAEVILEGKVAKQSLSGGQFKIPLAVLSGYWIHEVDAQDICLFSFMGENLQRFGVNAHEISTPDRLKTQEWARVIHDHPDQPDGIIYRSVQCNSENSVVIFGRAEDKLHAHEPEGLAWNIDELRRVLADMRIESDIDEPFENPAIEVDEALRSEHRRSDS